MHIGNEPWKKWITSKDKVPDRRVGSAIAKHIDKQSCLKRAIMIATAILIVAPIVEQSLYNAAPVFSATPSCTPATIKSIKASGYEYPNRPQNAFDGSLDTRWSNDGKGSWIKADLGTETTICGLDIAWYNGNERKNNFSVTVSKDGSRFQNVLTSTSTGTTLSSENYIFSSPVSARYVKVIVNGNTINNWASITEIDVLRYSATAPTTASPATSPISSPDTIQPTVAIRSHSNGQTVTVSNTPATLTISGTSFDSASGIQKVEVRTGTTSYQLATPKAPGDWSAWTNTRTFATTGTHAIVARATDNAGNQQWHEISVTIQREEDTADRTKPSVSITYPLNGAKMTIMSSGTETAFDIEGASFDSGSGVKSVEVAVGSNGGTYMLTNPVSPGDWSQWRHLTILPEGTHTVYAKATDNAGNTNTQMITVTVENEKDSVPPSIIAPADIFVESTNLLSVIVDLGEPSVSDLVDPSPDVSNNAPAFGFPIGTTQVTWTATDASGNAATDNQLVTVIGKSESLPTTDTDNIVDEEPVIGETPAIDKFGIEMLYETAESGREWFSNWDNGVKRSLSSGARDRYDAEFIVRGDGSVSIDGSGTATMTGSAPRMYVYDKEKSKIWNNVEVTFYAKRVGETNALSYQGFVAGTRTNHQDSGIDECLGAGYYGRMLYDGRINFQKEIVHHGAYSTTVPEPDPRNWWDTSNKSVPKNVWVGYKFVVKTVDDGRHVQLELYRDMSGGVNGGTWEKLVEYVDAGGWGQWDSDLNIFAECGKPADAILLDPGVSTFIRNDGISSAEYRQFSIREINPN